MKKKAKRIVNVKVLPGESLDGTGKVCVHLVVRDARGPFIEPYMLHVEDVEVDGRPMKELVSKPARARIACDRKRTVAPVTKNGVTTVTVRTDDPRAVTCPKCMVSADYREAMELWEPTGSNQSVNTVEIGK